MDKKEVSKITKEIYIKTEPDGNWV